MKKFLIFSLAVLFILTGVMIVKSMKTPKLKSVGKEPEKEYFEVAEKAEEHKNTDSTENAEAGTEKSGEDAEAEETEEAGTLEKQKPKREKSPFQSMMRS